VIERYLQRRREASKVRTAGRLMLTDPMFNLREVVKHMLLLEDHLANATKRCPDCIRKHLLTIEALADEATCLDCTGLWATACGNIAEKCRQWSEKLIDGGGPVEVSQEIRGLRKQLTPMVFDPRGREAVIRVASAYLHRLEIHS